MRRIPRVQYQGWAGALPEDVSPSAWTPVYPNAPGHRARALPIAILASTFLAWTPQPLPINPAQTVAYLATYPDAPGRRRPQLLEAVRSTYLGWCPAPIAFEPSQTSAYLATFPDAPGRRRPQLLEALRSTYLAWTPINIIPPLNPTLNKSWQPVYPDRPGHRRPALPEAVRAASGVVWVSRVRAWPTLPIGVDRVVQYYDVASGEWIDISNDTKMALDIDYGIEGNGPMDSVASSGRCDLVVRNDQFNDLQTISAYSPLHANCREAWDYDVPLRVIYFNNADPEKDAVFSGSGTIITVHVPNHGYRDGGWILATEAPFPGYYKITVVNDDYFTYDRDQEPPGNPPSPEDFPDVEGTVRRAYVKHYGKARDIDPTSGTWGPRDVLVSSYDVIRDLAEADVREVSIQVDKNETELTEEVLAAVDENVRPPFTQFDPGVDTFPYAFDNVGPGTKALALIADAVQSAFAMFVAYGDGTAVLKNRSFRSTGDARFSIPGNQQGFLGPGSLDQAPNVIRITSSLRKKDAAATAVIWQSEGEPISLLAGEIFEFWVTYRHPDDSQRLIGAVDVVNPLVAGTHFGANSLANGTGSNLAAFLDIELTPFATTAKIVLENTGGSTMYLVDGSGNPFLKLLGKKVLVTAELTYQSPSSGPATRPLNISLAYAANAAVLQSAAEFFYLQRSNLRFQPQELTIVMSASADFMYYGLEGEPGDVVTVSEDVTGFMLVNAIIQRVKISTDGEGIMTCVWSLAPSHPFSFGFWQWGIVDHSEWGMTTIYGF